MILHLGTSNWISKYGKLNCLSINCLFSHLFSMNAKKTHTYQSILQTFLLYLTRNVLQTFKSCSCKKFSPRCVYHWYNFLRWMFFIHCENWKTLFLCKLIVTQWFGATVMLLRSSKQVFWKRSVFYIRYLRNNITMLLIPK